MNKQDKPRICEVLGVEVDEQFEFVNSYGYKYTSVAVDCVGNIFYEQLGCRKDLSRSNICYLINHPESIVRRKRFTPQEIEDAKAIKRLIHNANGIRRGSDNIANIIRTMPFAPTLKYDAFPSIAPGESYTLDEIIGEGSE